MSLPMSRCLLAAALLLPWGSLDAQIPLPLRQSTDAIVRRADSLAQAGDTANAVLALEAEVHTRPRNAAAWHQLGLLQWSMAYRDRRGGFIREARVRNLLDGADSALRLATKFAKDSAQYWVSLARFNLQADVGSMHFAASRQMENAYNAAKKTGDSLFMAMGADEIGMAIWRRYETIANRAISANNQTLQLSTNALWRRSRAKDHLETFAHKIEPPTGKADYTQALERFREAVAIDPVNLRYSRHLFMALAEGGRWPELLAIANARAARSPFEARLRIER